MPTSIEEARRNLETRQRGRLTRLLRQVRQVEPEHLTRPREIRRPEKDMPILLAAMDGGATHLLTGDRERFGRYFRQEIGGVLILSPAEEVKRDLKARRECLANDLPDKNGNS